MPLSEYEIIEFVDESVSASGTPDLDAAFLNDHLQQRVYDLTEFANTLEATSGMTAAEILAALVTVDGPGSGLDADTLDGVSSAGFVPTSALGSNVATLTGGVLPVGQLPALAINEVLTAGSQAAMLALAAQRGDVAVRTDFTPDRTYQLAADDPTVLANWVHIASLGNINSVNGVGTGDVVLAASDVGALSTATRNAANGVAGLDASSLLSPAQMGSGTRTGFKRLRDDGTWQNTLLPQPFTAPDNPLVVGAVPLRWRVPFDITVVGFGLAVNTPPGGQAIVVDLDRAAAGSPGTMATLYSTPANRPQIAIGGYGAAATVPDTVNVPAGDFLQMRVAQVGTPSGSAGANLVGTVTYFVRG